MKDSRKEFIKNLHSEVSSGFKTVIEKEFPKLFKKDDLVVGNWYKSKKCLFNYQKYSNVYGFFGFEKWIDTNWSWSKRDSNVIPATDKEVEEARIKEAKKRGYKYRCVIESKKHGHVTLNDRGFYTFHGELWLGDCVLTNNGVWAKIVKETITKEQAQEATRILVEYNNQ
jgi:hypothetical protein